MAESNKDKIQKVLSEKFNKYRYIFWYDAEGAMEELVMGFSCGGRGSLVPTWLRSTLRSAISPWNSKSASLMIIYLSY